MKLYLVRHGESEGNVKRLIQGQKDYELTRKGLEQARLISERLRKDRFDAIYSSDLKRATQTAKEIIKKHDNELILTPALRERDFGSLADKRGIDINWDKLPSDVETIKEIEERLFKFINSIKEEGNILLVAHGGIIKAVLAKYTGRSFDEVSRIDNTSLSVLEIKDEKINVELENDIKHLS